MNLNKHGSAAPVVRWVIAFVLAGFVHVCVLPRDGGTAPVAPGESARGRDLSGAAYRCESRATDSSYIPVDSWVYPAVMRLYAMGYADNVFLGMRPWTRASVSRMLEETSAQISDADLYGDSTAGEAQDIYNALLRELHMDPENQCLSPMRRSAH